MNISKKQYLISPIRREIVGMSEINISIGYLYYGEGLLLRRLKDARDREYILIGHAFCMDRFPNTVEEDIATFSIDELTHLTQYWTGRWMLIRDDELMTDAGALMSAFYSDGDNWCVSSSLALIKRTLNLSCNSQVGNSGLTWHLLPDTLVEGINLLLCTQKLILSHNLTVKEKSLFYNRKNMTKEEKSLAIATMLECGLKNIYKYSGREVLLALTAGKDSRLVLASIIASKIRFSTYTMEHSNISSADIKLPPQIARDYCFKHTYIKRGKFQKPLFEDFIRFTSNNSRGADIDFYSFGQFEAIPKNSIIIRSGLFEAGQTYARRIAGCTLESFTSGIEKYYSYSFRDKRQRSAFNKWLENEQNNQLDYIDIRDRFYLEQRVSGWAAAIEQSMDLNDFVSIQIANCSELLSILISATNEERKCLALSYNVIKILDEKLLKYPVNRKTVHDKLRIYKNGIVKRCKKIFY